MSSDVFTPKQIAAALGVSESSVKRWVDTGRLSASRTVGGHRKVPLASLTQFVRETGQDVPRPELIGLVTAPTRGPLHGLIDDLFEALITGDEPACRQLLLGLYQRGESIAQIGDELVGPAFTRIGDGWAEGFVPVRQERRACEVVMDALHELRRWMPAPAESAPLAVIATPLSDYAEVPIRLVELLLVADGWRVVVSGSALPLGEIREAVVEHRPRLLCVSVTHLERPARFPREANLELFEPVAAAAAASPAPLDRVVGGNALSAERGAKLAVELFAQRLSQLVDHQRALLPAG